MRKKRIRCSPYPLKKTQAAIGLNCDKRFRSHIRKHSSTRNVVNHPKGVMNSPPLDAFDNQLKQKSVNDAALGRKAQPGAFWPMIYNRLQQSKRRLCQSRTQTYNLLPTGGQGKQSYLKFLSQSFSASVYTPEINSSPCTQCLTACQQVSSSHCRALKL